MDWTTNPTQRVAHCATHGAPKGVVRDRMGSTWLFVGACIQPTRVGRDATAP